MEIRLGIVGCGRISGAHGIAAQRLGDGVRFSACADVDEEAARRFANAYGSNSFYADYREMIGNEKLDGLVLATWPAQHREQIERAIEAGARFILCEKALALNGQEALEIWEMARDRGVTILEGFMYTHHPAIVRMDELVHRPESGTVDSVRASFHMFAPDPEPGKETWRQRKETGGSVPYDRTCYPVNACARFARALPVKVAATGTLSETYQTITRLYGQVTYENGCVGLIETSNAAVFSQELQVTCANRVYRLSTPFTMAGDATISEYEALKFSHVRTTEHPARSPLPLQDDLPTYHAYTPQLRRFVDAIRGGSAPKPRLIESVVNSYTLDALVQSLLTNSVVEVEIPHAAARAWRAARDN